MQKILVGADPEMFLYDPAMDRVVSAIDLLGGTKEHPRKVTNGALQEDNILAEFNIDPADSKANFIININSVVQQLRDSVMPLEPRAVASNECDEFLLMDPRARMFGCDPDFNAWTGEQNPAPNRANSLRTAGGHVHIGFNFTSPQHQRDVIRMCDYLMGVPSVLLDSDKRRRSMYGKAGCYRPKSYGVEYRTLSNFWLQSEELMGWIFDSAVKAVQTELLDEWEFDFPGHQVQDIINTSDVGMASYLCDMLNLEYPK